MTLQMNSKDIIIYHFSAQNYSSYTFSIGESFYTFSIGDNMMIRSSYRSGHRRKCRRCSLGTHCPKYRGPGRRTPHLDSQNFPRPGPGNRNSDRTRTFLVCSCNNIKKKPYLLPSCFILNILKLLNIKQLK